jgi:hypothetical protein
MKAWVPRRQPIPSPRQPAAATSFVSHFIYDDLVTWLWDTARVVSVLACRPQFPDMALERGRKPIINWYRWRPMSIHSRSLPPEIIKSTGISTSSVTIKAKNRSGKAVIRKHGYS